MGWRDASSGATPISLAEMQRLNIKIDLMVTGTSAISHSGIRLGKGHGFFDLEWDMLSRLEMVSAETPCVAVVHDCQVIDAVLQPDIFDTVCDLIVTHTQVIEIDVLQDRHAPKPSCGILWERLQPHMLDEIPPLQELQKLERSPRHASVAS